MTHLTAIALLAVLLLLPAAADAAEPPREFRAVWVHPKYAMDWDAMMQNLADHDFTAVIPLLSWGGVMYYPSDVLPMAPTKGDPRDELAACTEAAAKHGIEVHVWRVNWNVSRTPDSLAARLREEGRLQKDYFGRTGEGHGPGGGQWLCPSVDANRKLEAAAMLELAKREGVAGIHFDYMRFPGPTSCYCDSCRARFRRETGIVVKDWPRDVWKVYPRRPGPPPGGGRRGPRHQMPEGLPETSGRHADEFQQWRKDLLTSLVADIAGEARAARPDIQISLAAWPMLNAGMAQDWPLWVERGYLDFVCPMDYMPGNDMLARVVEQQIALVKNRAPVYVGLGAWQLPSAEDLAGKIELVRELGASGFVAFRYRYIRDWLPELKTTVLAD